MYFTAAQEDSPSVNMPLKPQSLTYLIYLYLVLHKKKVVLSYARRQFL